jgi:hypothetical protein
VRRAIALVCLAGACAGCGGDSDAPEDATPSTTDGAPTATTTTQGGLEGDEIGREAIPSTLIGAFASDDPKLACETYVTDRYLATAYGDRAGCEAAVQAGGLARELDIRSIEREADRAAALVVPDGGPSDGEPVRVSLVLAGGIWKVDGARSRVPVGP